MFVLVTNDDGIEAAGLQALVRELALHHHVAIVAPDRERSASGHAITMDRPLRARQVAHPAGLAWAVSGTPGDCVKLALGALLPQRPDVVISGINRGPNLGTDVFYSGTVAAAVEGVFAGLPALAVSLAAYDSDSDYSVASRVARSVAQRFVQKPALAQILLNINIPALPITKIKGVSITRLGIRRYRETFETRQDPRGQTYYWLVGEPMADADLSRDTDIAAVAEGRISITPLRLDLTDYQHLATLKAEYEGHFDI
ncbi:MAG TPA: 5'/3'-nucleotidase SurE [Firmicutes bacterium]|nr:5'/3'-nucleotidase SurE [Bacillota bacterium]